jgi:hypothetical protein
VSLAIRGRTESKNALEIVDKGGVDIGAVKLSNDDSNFAVDGGVLSTNPTDYCVAMSKL